MNIIRQPAPQIASDIRKSKFSNLEKIAAIGFLTTMAVSMLRTSQISQLQEQASTTASNILTADTTYASLLDKEKNLKQQEISQETAIQVKLAEVIRQETLEQNKADNNPISVKLNAEADQIATTRGHIVAEIFAILFVSVYAGNRLNRKKNGQA